MTKNKNKRRKNFDGENAPSKKSKLVDTLNIVYARTYGSDSDIYFEVISEDTGKCKMIPMHKDILVQNFHFFSAMFDPNSNWFINGEPKRLNELKLTTFEFIEEYMQACYTNATIISDHSNSKATALGPFDHSHSKMVKLTNINDVQSGSTASNLNLNSTAFPVGVSGPNPTPKSSSKASRKRSASGLANQPPLANSPDRASQKVTGLPKSLKKNSLAAAYFHFYDTYFMKKTPSVNPEDIQISKENLFTVYRFVPSRVQDCFNFFKCKANDLNYGQLAISVSQTDKARNITNFLKLPLNKFQDLNAVCQPIMMKSEWKMAENNRKMKIESQKAKDLKLAKKLQKEERRRKAHEPSNEWVNGILNNMEDHGDNRGAGEAALANDEDRDRDDREVEERARGMPGIAALRAINNRMVQRIANARRNLENAARDAPSPPGTPERAGSASTSNIKSDNRNSNSQERPKINLKTDVPDFIYWHAMLKMQSAYLKANDPKIAVQVLMVSDYSFVPTNEKFNFFQELAGKIPHNIFKDVYLKIFSDCRIHKPKDLVRDVKKKDKKKLAQKKRDKLKQKREAKSPKPGQGGAQGGNNNRNQNQNNQANRARNHRRIVGRARVRHAANQAARAGAEGHDQAAGGDAGGGGGNGGAAGGNAAGARVNEVNNLNNRQQRRVVEVIDRPARNVNQQNRQRNNNRAQQRGNIEDILDIGHGRLRNLIERRVRERPRF